MPRTCFWVRLNGGKILSLNVVQTPGAGQNCKRNKFLEIHGHIDGDEMEVSFLGKEDYFGDDVLVREGRRLSGMGE